MPESGPYGSMRGALSNERPYRDPDDETDHALKRPATKKRQGTKSRAVGQWLAAGAMGI
jgi:hypothetical protein